MCISVLDGISGHKTTLPVLGVVSGHGKNVFTIYIEDKYM